MSNFSYSIPNLLNSIKAKSTATSVGNLLNSTSASEYANNLKSLTEDVFFEPLQDLTEIDAFTITGGSFNLPVFAPLIIHFPIKIGGKGAALDVAKQALGAASGFKIDGVSLEVSRSKNIVTTAVQGRDYTIKEFISNNDHNITVNGIIASNGTGYPTAEVVVLRKLMEHKGELKITNSVLHKLGIFELVITDFNFPGNDGVKNIQPFSFNAISEVPLEVKQNFLGELKQQGIAAAGSLASGLNPF